jgi:hypothetical protein
MHPVCYRSFALMQTPPDLDHNPKNVSQIWTASCNRKRTQLDPRARLIASPLAYASVIVKDAMSQEHFAILGAS